MKIHRLAWTIFALIALALVFHPLVIGRAHAAPTVEGTTADGQPMMLRLLNAPCGAKVLVHLREKAKPDVVRLFKAAVLTWQGKVYASCWVDMGGQVYSIDEAGDVLQGIPRAYFRDDSV